jgi:pSer/pThr/pTyr-binding forkhead associated (FHA) protein
MRARLVIVGGKANKGEVVLKLPCLIGRSRDANLTIAHPMISRRHCELSEADGRLQLRDLKSLNGTFVGGQRIEETQLADGDEFAIGPLAFRVEYVEDEPVEVIEAAPASASDDAPSPAPAAPERATAPLPADDLPPPLPGEGFPDFAGWDAAVRGQDEFVRFEGATDLVRPEDLSDALAPKESPDSTGTSLDIGKDKSGG